MPTNIPKFKMVISNHITLRNGFMQFVWQVHFSIIKQISIFSIY